jgi:pimeloyl-ACP methyl ester carboxylesterase
MPNEKITVALVHGAWAECASWNPVLPVLQKTGLEVVCAPILLTSLSDDVNALDRALARIEGDIVLVGHAYAGAVIGATKNERVKLLIYVAALAPNEGETVAEVFYREAPHPEAPQLSPDADGYIWMPADGFDRAFAQNADPELKALLMATQRPINVKCIQEKVPRPLWRDRPS